MCMVALSTVWAAACSETLKSPSVSETDDISMTVPDGGADGVSNGGVPGSGADGVPDSGADGVPDSGADGVPDSGPATCPDGYVLNSGNCVDIDECARDNGGCGEVGRATCLNHEGKPATCGDIDECANGDNGGCGAKAGYKCVNKDRVPPNCIDLAACDKDNGGCGKPAFNRCSYDSEGEVLCSDVNECEDSDNGGCGDDSAMTCVNEVNARNSCADIDECANDSDACPVETPCVNVKGSYFCACDYPTIYDPSLARCRAARVLVLDDKGSTTLVEDLKKELFDVEDGGPYYEWNQSPDLSNIDTVLWLEGKELHYGKALRSGMDELLANYVAAGGGLIRTEWSLWIASMQQLLGNAAVNPATVRLMPVGLTPDAFFAEVGYSWTVTNPTSPLTRNLPATIATTGGYSLLDLLPGSEAVATTFDVRAVGGVTLETVVPVVSYTAIHGGITVHVNDTLLYNNGVRTSLPSGIKQVYFNAVHFSAQRPPN